MSRVAVVGDSISAGSPLWDPDPAVRAVRMALEMREAASALTAVWRRRGYELVGRVDLKADRAAGVLRVRAAWSERPAPSPEVAEELALELAEMARWLGLDAVAHRGSRAHPVRPLGLAGLAALGFVLELLVGEEELFTGRPDKL